jgi:hypothetical protein
MTSVLVADLGRRSVRILYRFDDAHLFASTTPGTPPVPLES